jgi:hypothetical protein
VFEVKILNADNVVGWGPARFDTEADADAWILYQESAGSWGDVHTVEKTDITQQVADELAVQRGLIAQQVGNKCIALVYAINSQKNVSTDQLQAMFADPSLAMIERLLKNGALQTAKSMLSIMPNTFFTAIEVARVISVIDSSGLV